MNYKNLNYLVLFIYLISSSSSYSIERTDIKNLIIHKEKKKIEKVEFFNSKNKKVILNDYNSKLVIINFWATWCAPCCEEMPSLDLLQSDKRLNNLKIFPINVGKENIIKSKNFFKELNIQNLDIYFDPTVNLANKFLLRGLPTTILINKKGQEFARIIGYIDFGDDKFINWLKNFN